MMVDPYDPVSILTAGCCSSTPPKRLAVEPKEMPQPIHKVQTTWTDMLMLALAGIEIPALLYLWWIGVLS